MRPTATANLKTVNNKMMSFNANSAKMDMRSMTMVLVCSKDAKMNLTTRHATNASLLMSWKTVSVLMPIVNNFQMRLAQNAKRSIIGTMRRLFVRHFKTKIVRKSINRENVKNAKISFSLIRTRSV